MENVITLDERNRMVGRAEKLTAHRAGLLHRAFSIFLLDEEGRIVCQRRHPSKYHSGGLWANTCCGHPRPFEKTSVAARRRLFEELGVDARLSFSFRARYCEKVSDDLIENELVYVYFGRLVGALRPAPREVDALDALSLEDLRREASGRPGRHAVWLHHYLQHHAGDLDRAVAATVQSGSVPLDKARDPD